MFAGVELFVLADTGEFGTRFWLVAGLFGLIQVLATLHDEHGNTTVDDLALAGFHRPDSGDPLAIKFSFSVHQESGQCDSWDVEIDGAQDREEGERQPADDDAEARRGSEGRDGERYRGARRE